ncbi:unnamed protein product [Rotaria sp. Silwood2]|nr:unnamed protein product [Rotaria sp. Silwood2]CAF2693026.1 unnamed protein product [Rotaria sp. Silwood2]CAF4409391.1 unnamed protein product [Rotaria sp. Silwood2]CAF4418852.1 unnamed protein product [Rotaria sp. Silwood2]
MRTIYWGRCSLVSKILLTLLFGIIIVTLQLYVKHMNIISIVYDTSINCHELKKNSLIESSSIPPEYLLIPYREFVLRTSISCRSFKFDEPKKKLSEFHPKFSQYLHGTFPIVIPYSNITFDDVENFYTQILIKKQNQTHIQKISFASNITFENIPYRYENGMWYPIEVTSSQRTAILVPLQGRDYNAKVYPLGSRFNKGRLYNAGIRYIEQQSLNITCLILHDVDLIPENDGNFYSCESRHPKHTTTRVRQLNSTHRYARYYEFLIGGVLLLTLDMYKSVNGFSNLYWGWGGEDDDLSLRLIQRRMCVVRPSYELAIYTALPHPKGQRNGARFQLLAWSTVRLNADGYKQIDSMIRIVDIRKTSTVIHLKIDVDANQSLYKPPSKKNFLSSFNETYDYITTTSKTVTTTTPTVLQTTPL